MRKHRLLLLHVQPDICKQLLARENERGTQDSARCYFMPVIYSAVWSMIKTKSPISSGSHECFKAAVGAPGYSSSVRLSPLRKKYQDLFLSAWTRNNANESAGALHYFLNERTKMPFYSPISGELAGILASSSSSQWDRITQHLLQGPSIGEYLHFLYFLEACVWHENKDTYTHIWNRECCFHLIVVEENQI